VLSSAASAESAFRSGCEPAPLAESWLPYALAFTLNILAAFAGALGIRLGGTNAYSGVAEERPWLGDGRAPEPADIARAVRLCRAITAAAAIGAAAAVMITGRAARAIGEEAR